MDRRVLIGLFLAAAVLIAVGFAMIGDFGRMYATPTLPPLPETALEPSEQDKFAQDRNLLAGVKEVPYDAERSMKYLKQLWDLGPRICGTDGIKKSQEAITKHFEALGGKVEKQEFQAKQRSRRDKTPMTNLIVKWYPEKTKRIILCCHYDTRPIADQEAERRNWNRPFIGANDGTSAVAMLMELAHHMKGLTPAVGVDFVFFDGEEYIFNNDPVSGDNYFIGSEHFAREYATNRANLGFTYEGAMLFDLCHHDGAVLRVEMNSWESANGLCTQIWKLAEASGAKSFKFERGEAVRDDHLALNAVRIPAVDIIDFSYVHWHKLSDTIDKVSPKQMAEVAKVAMAWVQTAK